MKKITVLAVLAFACLLTLGLLNSKPKEPFDESKLIAAQDPVYDKTPFPSTDELPAEKMGKYPVQMPSTEGGVVQLLPLSNEWVIVVTNNLPEICDQIGKLVRADPAWSNLDFVAEQKHWMDSKAASKPDYYLYKRNVVPQVAKYLGQARLDIGELNMDKATYYSIISSDDPQYQSELNPAAVTRFVNAIGGEVYGGIMTNFAQYSYLKMPAPMVQDKTYTISLQNGKTVTFTYDEFTLVSRAIKVNQTGYLPDAKKIAYIGGFLQDLGPLVIPENTSFTVHEVNTGSEVASGTVKLRSANPKFTGTTTPVSGENIYELDFSTLKDPGVYFISVKGVGRSWPFSIDKNAYAEAFYTQVRGFYHQRCGIEIMQPYSPWHRIKCHQAPVGTSKYVPIFFEPVQDPAKWSIFDIMAASTDMSKPIVDHSGGWHDAGDWDRSLRHYTVVFDLLSLYELKPKNFTDNQFNIPESGNGIPDILDEAEYGLLVWKKSMTPEGGVSGFLETTAHPTLDDPAYKFAYSLPSRWTSLIFAAAAAQYSQLVQPFDVAKAAEYKELALKAYAYGMDPKNSLGTYTVPAAKDRGKGPAYTFTFVENENFNKPFVIGAKLRLFLLTQDTSYLEGMHQLLEDVKAGFSFVQADGTSKKITLLPAQWPFVPQDCGLWMYAPLMQLYPDKLAAILSDSGALDAVAKAVPKADLDWWKNNFVKLGDTYANFNNAEFYRRSRGLNQEKQMSWGADVMTNPSKILLFAHYLTGNDKYKQAALWNCDYMLGGNASGTCWTTGIGFVYPVPIHHQVSSFDGIPDPVPGIQLYGPNEGTLSSLNSTLWLPLDTAGRPIQMMKTGLYTNSQVVLPRLRNWQAHSDLLVGMNEFTIWETMSGAAFTYGYLLEEGWQPPEWLKTRVPRDPKILFGIYYVP